MNHKYKFMNRNLAIFFLIGVVACQDLKEMPKGLVSPTVFYSTVAQGESALTASMAALWSEWGPGYSYGYGNFIEDDQLLNGDANIGNGYGNDLWVQHYLAVNNINGVIRALKNGSIKGVAQQQLDELEGQARFLRAFNYFNLVRLYGPLPLIIETTPDPVSTPVKERASIANVYAQIVSDFQFAVDHLPVSWSGAPGKPTRGAAQALLAKSYLTMATAPLNDKSNYSKARDMAKAIITEGHYSLVTDINKVFMPENKFAPENIWGFISTLDDVATWPQIWTPAIMEGWGDASIDLLWAENWLTQRPKEPRQNAYLLLEYNGVPYTDFEEARPFVKKWIMPYITQQQYDNYQSDSFTPIIRYADVLLIYAEAANMAGTGPTPEAYQALNSIRRRANSLPSGNANVAVDLPAGVSQADFDKAVIEERNFELVLEYDRWFDIVRKRMLLDLTAKYHPENIANVSDDDYLYPIPEFDAKILGSQNPGYTKPE